MKIKANGITMNYELKGSGPCVMFSHSLACNFHMWDEQMEAFASRYTVLRYDTRGHGETDAPPGQYTLELLADDVYALLGALGIKQAHWVGLSMGGMIGQTFALKYPGVFQSLVLADTTSYYPPETQPAWQERIKVVTAGGMAPIVDVMLERWFTAPFRKSHPEVTQRIGRYIAATPVAGFLGCCHAIPKINVTQRLKEISCPTLVIVGEQDPGTPVAMARDIHAALPGSELLIIPSAAHLSNIEQAQAFNDAVLAFLGRAAR